MKEHLTLEKVVEAFAMWRQTRNKRGKIPEYLIQQVSQLKKYPHTKLAQALKLNHSTLKGIIKNSKEIEFINLPVMTEPQPISTIACTLSRRDGALLKMELNHSQMPDFLRTFLCCK